MLQLHVYDFDGTLFGSPPPPADFSGHPGNWWASADSLSEPYVPDVPSGWWYNTNVVALAKRSIADPNVYAVLMTGRPSSNAALRFRVAELLKNSGLDFDAVYLSEPDMSTDAFKVQKIQDVLTRNRNIKEAHFWDDRVHHLPAFVRMAEKMGVTGVPHPVTRFERTIRQVDEMTMFSYTLFEGTERREKMLMDLPSDLLQVYDIIKPHGELYVVGGAVRDALLDKSPKDYDLATDLTPAEVMQAFGATSKQIESDEPVQVNGYKLDLTGKAFGVIRAWTPEKNEYEIATMRTESPKKPTLIEFLKFLKKHGVDGMTLKKFIRASTK